MEIGIDRRRFIKVSAAAAGLSLVPFGMARKSAAAQLVEWNGLSLGAVATVRIHHQDQLEAQQLLKRVVAETRRLELIFSLYRDDSWLCELNRRGVLIGPPRELVELLVECDRFWRVTQGKFDPTVQPLWQCYADHFARKGDPAGPSEVKVKEALELVGWKKVRFNPDEVVFERRGMGLTLNGIAQGYITDCTTKLLRAAGIENCLVDMGEIRGLGSDADGGPWEVAIDNPLGEADERRRVSLVNKAVATSAAAGFQFDDAGRCNHLFDPSNGACATPTRSLTVVAPTATTADAASTAFSLMSEGQIRSVCSQLTQLEVFLTTKYGTREIKLSV
jgi:thiamine biosynthesis lipoprotein